MASKKSGKKSSAEELKEAEEFLKKIRNSTSSLEDEIKDLSDVYKDMADVLQNAVDNADKFGKEWSEVEDISKALLRNLKSVGDSSYKQTGLQGKLNQLLHKAKSLEADRTKAQDYINQSKKAEIDATKKLNGLEKNLLKAEESKNEQAIQALKTKIDAAKIAIDAAKRNQDDYENEKNKVEQAEEYLKTQEEILNGLKKQEDVLNRANDVAKEMGINVKEMADEIAAPFQKALDLVKQLPGGNFLYKAFGLDSIMDKVKDTVYKSFTASLAAAGEGSKSFFTVLKAGFKAAIAGARVFLKAIAPILIPLIAIATTLAAIKKAFDIDQEITNMARNLGLTKKETLGIYKDLNNMAITTKVIGANTKELIKEYEVLAKAFGVSKLANEEMAETQVYLTKQLGMSSDEAANFQKMSMGTGRTAYQNLAVIKAGVESMTDGLMSYKEVAHDIAKSSKAVQAAYKGNIVALTKAVITAKKFGMTLDEAKKSADSILDIESSVESEMKANVLTGKHMNLNAARQLAIQGKSAEAVEEMMNQAGGYDELMSLAPYKQKAIADAMGMSVDEMIKAAEHQKNLNTMAEELGITLDKNGKMSEDDMKRALASNNAEAKKLAIQQQQASVQEKLAALADKMFAIFGAIATILMPIVSAIEWMITGISDGIVVALKSVKSLWDAIYPIVVGIGAAIGVMLLPSLWSAVSAMTIMAVEQLPAIYSGIVKWGASMLPVVVSMAKAAIAAITTASAMSLGLGIAAVIVGIAAAAAAFNSQKDQAKNVQDAMIDPKGGLVVSGPKGTYQLDSNDSVIAGTELDSSQKTTSGVTNQEDTTGLNTLGDLVSTMINPFSALVPGGNNVDNKEVVSLLKELIAKIDQPIKINIGGKVIEELESQASMRRSYNTKIDGAYGVNG